MVGYISDVIKNSLMVNSKRNVTPNSVSMSRLSSTYGKIAYCEPHRCLVEINGYTDAVTGYMGPRRGGGALLAGSSGRGLICDVYWLGGRVGYTGHVILPNTGRGVEISRP